MKTEVLSGALKNIISIQQAWHYKIIPQKEQDDTYYYYISEEQNKREIADELEVVLGQKVVLQPVGGDDISQLLNIHYPRAERAEDNGRRSLQARETGFIEYLINEAKELRSSDIHIEKYSEYCRIRFRVDGLLVDRHKIQKQDYPTLINKIKICANCDIAEKRIPQDGRIRLELNKSPLDIRVSILPTLYGEKIVMRLLGSDASHIDLSRLGFTDSELQKYDLAIKKPNGIILISGPTGSGKTTTLYATLKQLNKVSRNIVTIEDPIEYTLDGVNQVQLKEEIGLGYQEALKSFLRQDPDIIMLGEIRDSKTAQMAIRAALTGHLVLSTIHTNSAWGTISRLADMGIPPYLISNVLSLSVAQRLVRLLCETCKRKGTQPEELPGKYNKRHPKEFFVACGCEDCFYTGYKGRRAIYEVLHIDKYVSEQIRASATDIESYQEKEGIKSLAENAFQLFESGVTSLDEVYSFLINEL